MRSSIVFVALASLAATAMAVGEIKPIYVRFLNCLLIFGLLDLPNPVNTTTSSVSSPVSSPVSSGVETPSVETLSVETPSGPEPPYLSTPTGYTSATESPYPTGATNGTNGTTTHTPTVAPEGVGATFGPAGMLGLAVAGIAVVAGAAIF